MDLIERKKDLLKEIDLIQAIINRMSNTSFLIKGWAVTMISFIFSFRANETNLVLVVIPLLLFWFLDAYFLRQERSYRKLYQWVIDNRMQDDSYLFSLNPSRFMQDEKSIFKTMLSITLLVFYGVALLLSIIYIIFFSPNSI
ncbi:MAG: hypothetical protein KAH84_10300 [Thiomargarita sp.]|nr:hypothetical protein [Thiomargarita sp.]